MSDEVLKDKTIDYSAGEYHSPYRSLANELYWERVERARQMSPEEKFLAGEELFEYACSITLAGIKAQNPAFSDEDCRRELERRLEWRRRADAKK